MLCCKICEKEFKNYTTLSIHIRKYHKIKIKEYYDLYLKKENEGICPLCGKETNFINLKHCYRHFCSKQCLNKSDYHKDKIKKTCLKHYGVEYSFQDKEIKEKIKKTNLEKYGVEHVLQNKEIYEKQKQTIIEKYGAENYSKSNEYKDLKRNETIEKYKNEFPKLNIIDYNINNSIMTCYCTECNKNYNIGLMLLGDRLRYRNFNNPCTNCFPIDTHFSIQEKELLDFIKLIYCGEIIENDRSVLNNKELDIYLPNLKIGFEYNGLYWHSIDFKNENYHLNKTIECEKQGIQLIHIFENEWLNNKENIKQYIKDLINNTVNFKNYNLIFKKENNKIIVDRQFSNGFILEQSGYKLQEILKPTPEKINVNNKIYEIYNCGYLIYKKK